VLVDGDVATLKNGFFELWLPLVDEFRNFLMSEEADIVLEHVKDF
jgi:hypothetical protein